MIFGETDVKRCASLVFYLYILSKKKDDWGLNNELWRCKSEMNNG